MAKRIQRSRSRGWRMPPGTRYVGRPGKFGNPYQLNDHSPQEAVELYRQYVLGTPDLLAAVRSELRGLDLACWCRVGEPCHADVLIELAKGND